MRFYKSGITKHRMLRSWCFIFPKVYIDFSFIWGSSSFERFTQFRKSFSTVAFLNFLSFHLSVILILILSNLGSKPSEIAIMNTLTVNLHLLMVSIRRSILQKIFIVKKTYNKPSLTFTLSLLQPILPSSFHSIMTF